MNGVNAASGVGQVELVNEGYFYFFIRYGHYSNGVQIGAERLAFRIAYDPSAPGSLGSQRQIFYDGTWRNNSGKLVWDYDKCGGQQCPPSPGDFVLSPNHGLHRMGFGGGVVRFDPYFSFGEDIQFYQSQPGPPIEWDFTDSAYNADGWTYGGQVDFTTVNNTYPNSQLYYPGVYFGPLLQRV